MKDGSSCKEIADCGNKNVTPLPADGSIWSNPKLEDMIKKRGVLGEENAEDYDKKGFETMMPIDFTDKKVKGKRKCKGGWVDATAPGDKGTTKEYHCPITQYTFQNDDYYDKKGIRWNDLAGACKDGYFPLYSWARADVWPGSEEWYEFTTGVACGSKQQASCCTGELSPEDCPECYCPANKNRCDSYMKKLCDDYPDLEECGCLKPNLTEPEQRLVEAMEKAGLSIPNACFASCQTNDFAYPNTDLKPCNIDICLQFQDFSNDTDSNIDISNTRWAQYCGQNSYSPDGGDGNGGNGGNGNGSGNGGSIWDGPGSTSDKVKKWIKKYWWIILLVGIIVLFLIIILIVVATRGSTEIVTEDSEDESSKFDPNNLEDIPSS